MATIRLTKEFRFEAAHALEGYHGKCKHIHGHSYILYVTVTGVPCTDKQSSTCGMVMDFGDLKQLVNTHIIDKLDHALILRKDAKLVDDLQHSYGRLVLTDFQPTCENMLVDFAKTLQQNLPSHVKLYKLKLHETASSFAEWYASDNAE